MLNNTNKQKIYSIQLGTNKSGLIEIETIILNGLYKFSILGINQKHSSDTRDRIYSALRSQKLINLKSDNKKITVNLLPADIDIKNNIYDLGIALSCLYYMYKINIEDDMLIIGELSIVGNIIPTGFLLKCIYQAIKNNIKIIICSQLDINIFNNNNLYKLIEDNNIKIITGETLNVLFENIKKKNYFSFESHKPNNINTDLPLLFNDNFKSIDISDINILKIILAICTKRNIFIENTKNSYIKKFINNLKYYSQKINNNEILILADKLNISDRQILEKNIYTKISLLDSQVSKNDLILLLNESIFGFNIIENFLSVNDELLYMIKKFHLSSIICFYNPCPCGNNNIFFNSINSDRCFCIQKNILKYRQNIKKIENNFFDLYINNIDFIDTQYTSDDYITVNRIISNFRNTTVEIEEGEVVKIFIKNNINKYEIEDLDKITVLARDICKLNHITKNEDLKLNQSHIDLAETLIKRDF